MKKNIVAGVLLLFYLPSLNADDSLSDFEAILGEATQIATQKSINVDYMPSVVTVIDAQTYVDAGIQNVGEALGMLPGIQMQMNYLGQPRTTIRGFNNPNSFISDKVKILVDGVAIHNEAAGTAGFFMDFPMDLVDRIEVLRGPGSTVYGAGAIYGTVNIITKTGNQEKESSFYWGIGSYKNATTGGNFNATAGDFQIYTDAYYSQNEKGIFDEEILKTTDEEKEDLSVGIKVVNKGFEFLSRYKSSHYGNFYLYPGDPHPNMDRGRQLDYFLSQLSYKANFNDYKLNTKLKYSYRESDITAYASPEVFYIRDHQVEQNVEAEAILELPEIYSNDITVGIGVRQVLMNTDDFYSNIEDAIDANPAVRDNPNDYDIIHEPAYWLDPTSTELYSKDSRTISHINIQDLITLNTKVDFTLGARIDHYSDIGTHFSSQAGLVYRANDSLILKLLYGSAFRAPTFTEMYSKGHIYFRAGDQNLKEETVDTYEVAMIYKPNFYNKISLNFFYSTLKDVIDIEELKFSTPEGYQNMKERSSKGVEFEYFFKPNLKHNLYINATYVESDYTVPEEDNISKDIVYHEIDQSMPDISKYMFKAMYVYKPTNYLSFGTTWQYYSETTRTKLLWAVNSQRNTPADKQSIFDETITFHFASSSQLRFTVKNLFNQEVRLPSYYYTQPGGVLREGRNYYLTYKYTF